MPYSMDHFIEQNDVYLYPGEVLSSNKNIRIITLLGTCVSIILYNKQYKLGGILHGLLPSINDTNKNNANATHYIDSAFYIILEKFLSMGIRRDEIIAKVFGGACLLKSMMKNCIAAKNIEISKILLEKEKIKVIAKDVGGQKARKLIFHPNNGEVYMKYIQNNDLFFNKKTVGQLLEKNNG
jgi:chemotaxis protein CheD